MENFYIPNFTSLYPSHNRPGKDCRNYKKRKKVELPSNDFIVLPGYGQMVKFKSIPVNNEIKSFGYKPRFKYIETLRETLRYLSTEVLRLLGIKKQKS